MKEKVYESCLRSGLLYGSKGWCLREKEMSTLRGTERAMCGVKPLDQRKSEKMIDMLGIESLNWMAKASSMQWIGHVLRKKDENLIIEALKFEVRGTRGRRQPK